MRDSKQAQMLCGLIKQGDQPSAFTNTNPSTQSKAKARLCLDSIAIVFAPNTPDISKGSLSLAAGYLHFYYLHQSAFNEPPQSFPVLAVATSSAAPLLALWPQPLWPHRMRSRPLLRRHTLLLLISPTPSWKSNPPQLLEESTSLNHLVRPSFLQTSLPAPALSCTFIHIILPLHSLLLRSFQTQKYSAESCRSLAVDRR